jgi:predicted phage terminase large subunit-like protein
MKQKISAQEVVAWRKARWLARFDLIYLCNEILGYVDVSDKVHGGLIKTLQAFPKPTREQFEANDIYENGRWKYKPIYTLKEFVKLPGKRRRLILDSRGHLKTTINCQAHTIQWLLNYPDAAIHIIQSNLDKGNMIVDEIRDHFRHNPRLRQLFPELCPQKSVNDFGKVGQFNIRPFYDITSMRKEPSVLAGSIEKGTAGLHFDVIKFSDIVDPNNCYGDMLDKVAKSFYMAENLLVAPSYWIDVEGTRYNFGDVYGKIIEGYEKAKKENREPEYLMYVRACFERDTGEKPPEYTPEEQNLPFKKDKEGKRIPVWPERFTLQKLEEMERTDQATFSCTPSWAKILKADWSESDISTIKVGDEIIGFDNVYVPSETPRLIKTKVKAVFSKTADVYKLSLSNGENIYCTLDHKWYMGKRGGGKKIYDVPKIGSELWRLFAVHGILGKKELIYKNLENRASHFGTKVKILDITYHSTETVYALETETGNYISQGYASSNSQQLNFPIGGVDGQVLFPVDPKENYPALIDEDKFKQNIRVSHYEISVDTAETVGGRSDYTAMAVAAWSKSGRPYIVDIIYGKWLPNQIVSNLLALYIKWNKSKISPVLKIKIEETGFVRGLNAAIGREEEVLQKKYPGFKLPLEFIKRDTSLSKTERILKTLQPWYINREMRFLSNIEALEALKKQLIQFPNSPNDDILDCLSDFFNGKEYFGRLDAKPEIEIYKSKMEEAALGILSPWDEDAEYYTTEGIPKLSGVPW